MQLIGSVSILKLAQFVSWSCHFTFESLNLSVGIADILAAAHAIFQTHNVRDMILNISLSFSPQLPSSFPCSDFLGFLFRMELGRLMKFLVIHIRQYPFSTRMARRY